MPATPGAPSEASLAPADDGDDEEDDGDFGSDTPAAGPGGEPAVAAAPERSGFSLFSWLRREPDDKKQ
jgi:hypothetical protein